MDATINGLPVSERLVRPATPLDVIHAVKVWSCKYQTTLMQPYHPLIADLHLFLDEIQKGIKEAQP